MSFPSFEAAKTGYGNLWRSMRIRPEKRAALERAARTILRGKSRYAAVERSTGVPWFVVGLAHYREAGCSFACHLHNGDDGRPDANGRLTLRTRRVPPGRPASPPPWSWEDSARDALAIDRLSTIRDWSIERIGYTVEKFNGQGYFSRNVNSPYVWAGSNHYGAPPNVGKYVADHVFDSHAVDSQLGCMPILSVMMELDSSIGARLGEKPDRVPPSPDIEPPKPRPDLGRPSTHPVSVAVGGAAAAIAAWWGAHPVVAVAAFIVAFLIAAIIMSKRT